MEMLIEGRVGVVFGVLICGVDVEVDGVELDELGEEGGLVVFSIGGEVLEGVDRSGGVEVGVPGRDDGDGMLAFEP